MLKVKKYRVQLDFPADSFQELEQLRADMGGCTRGTAFRHAISLLQFVVHEYRVGKQLVVRDPQTKELELVLLPFLRKAMKVKK